MIPPTAISDASPLIALTQIDELEILRLLFENVAVPPAVALEVAPSVRLPDWVAVRSVSHIVDLADAPASLGPGEVEAISLALEINAGRIILDDRKARLFAMRLGLPLTGTAGLFLLAKQCGVVAVVRPYLDALLAVDFHLSPDRYATILRAADEE